MSAVQTALHVRTEHILLAAIRDHVVPVRIYRLTSEAINMLTVRLVLQQEAVLIIHARRDIIGRKAAAAQNVRTAVLPVPILLRAFTAPPVQQHITSAAQMD